MPCLLFSRKNMRLLTFFLAYFPITKSCSENYSNLKGISDDANRFPMLIVTVNNIQTFSNPQGPESTNETEPESCEKHWDDLRRESLIEPPYIFSLGGDLQIKLTGLQIPSNSIDSFQVEGKPCTIKLRQVSHLNVSCPDLQKQPVNQSKALSVILTRQGEESPGSANTSDQLRMLQRLQAEPDPIITLPIDTIQSLKIARVRFVIEGQNLCSLYNPFVQLQKFPNPEPCQINGPSRLICRAPILPSTDPKYHQLTKPISLISRFFSHGKSLDGRHLAAPIHIEYWPDPWFDKAEFKHETGLIEIPVHGHLAVPMLSRVLLRSPVSSNYVVDCRIIPTESLEALRLIQCKPENWYHKYPIWNVSVEIGQQEFSLGLVDNFPPGLTRLRWLIAIITSLMVIILVALVMTIFKYKTSPEFGDKLDSWLFRDEDLEQMNKLWAKGIFDIFRQPKPVSGERFPTRPTGAAKRPPVVATPLASPLLPGDVDKAPPSPATGVPPATGPAVRPQVPARPPIKPIKLGKPMIKGPIRPPPIEGIKVFRSDMSDSRADLVIVKFAGKSKSLGKVPAKVTSQNLVNNQPEVNPIGPNLTVITGKTSLVNEKKNLINEKKALIASTKSKLSLVANKNSKLKLSTVLPPEAKKLG